MILFAQIVQALMHLIISGLARFDSDLITSVRLII